MLDMLVNYLWSLVSGLWSLVSGLWSGFMTMLLTGYLPPYYTKFLVMPRHPQSRRILSIWLTRSNADGLVS